MKVLYLVSGIGPPAGWGTEFIQNLIFALSKKGVEATIISPIYAHTHPEWKKWTSEQEAKFGVRIISLEAPLWIRKNFLLHLALTPLFVTFCALRLCMKEKFDIVHEFSSIPVILFRHIIFRVFFGIPTVFTLSVYNNTFLGSFFWFKLFDFARFYLIPSKEIASKLQSLGVSKTKIVYSPPCININLFKNPINRLKARKDLNLPQGKFIVSYFGSLTREKGIEIILQAANLLKDQNDILIVMYVVWKGSTEHKEYKDKIAAFRLGNLRLEEKFIDIPTLLGATDVVILPQLTGHGATIPPLSALEAIVATKWVIATDILGNREWINHNNGVLIKSGDGQALARAIKEIRLKVKNRQGPKVNKNFYNTPHQEEMVKKHLSIYKNAM